MKLFPCPYLGSEVELTDERAQHIIKTHPGTLPDYINEMAATLANPDEVRRSRRDPNALCSFLNGLRQFAPDVIWWWLQSVNLISRGIG
jgi:hypothetical protein